MLQTESPYFQPTPSPPAPFWNSVGIFPGDPTFICGHQSAALTGCGDSWSTIIQGSQDIFIASAGVYSWFSTYSQTCIDKQECQGALVRLTNNKANVRIQNLVTIGATNMVVMDGQGISAASNLNVNTHPFWSLITNLDVGHDGATDFTELIWIDPVIWDMAQPSFTCVPPCHVKLPPYPGPTSTVNYPLMTVSSGTWTSTITQAPITISEWILETVTILADGSDNKAKAAKRDVHQGFTAFRPIAATTPYWPAIAYTGPNGERTVTSPSGPFPTNKIVIDKDIKPWQGYNDTPTYKPCLYFDFGCVTQPWMVSPGPEEPGGGNSDDGYADDSGYDNPEDLLFTCTISQRLRPTIISPGTSSSSSSTSSTATSTSSIKILPTGDPSLNQVTCYDSGETTENQRMLDSATEFCTGLADNIAAIGPGYIHTTSKDFDYNGGTGGVRMVTSFYIYPNCTWKYNMQECQRYLKVPDDSCNCSGIDGKQGGYVKNNCYEWRMDPNRYEKW
ncbi:hypothetical protein SBRCBS47491_009569 [Sporothrix bragantina]|uniref:Uncharacterized protein n=1 Tax=Sporothrix bragantina TaxID=671064 RepID=A0ABP0CY85_9PEZI